MKVYILQHVPFETPGSLAYLDAHIIKLYETPVRIPDAQQVDVLIILGGPMSVNDDIPWLAEERALIIAMLKQQKPMLGICLGAQLIAQVLGATIYTNSAGKKVGFSNIKKTTSRYNFLPETLDVLHWHGETFSLPPGAERLYCSPYCENQAFIYKDCVIGLQFHLETTSQTLQDLVAADYKYIEGNVLQQTRDSILQHEIPTDNQIVLSKIMDHLIGGCTYGETYS